LKNSLKILIDPGYFSISDREADTDEMNERW